jgi:hypothetical protein
MVPEAWNDARPREPRGGCDTSLYHEEMNVASVRLDNALALFDEFVRNTIRHPDAATLRGLERRFAERLQIQPSYWSQIKSRSRQIGERLARQFEQCCAKPVGWMDVPHDAGGGDAAASAHAGAAGAALAPPVPDSPLPQDDDERFITGLVLTYYRRHPQRARTRLLDLLGEVLVPPGESGAPARVPPVPAGAAQAAPTPVPGTRPGTVVRRAASPRLSPADEAHALWLQAQSGIAPLKKKR